jgi:hypothetical protein
MEPLQKISSSLQDKWIATIAWVALLFALVYTSGEIATISYSMNLYGFSTPERTGGLSIDLVTLVLFGAMVIFIINAWLKYLSLSSELYIHFADKTESKTVFENLLLLSEHKMAESTMIGDVIKPLSIAWGISIIAPVIFSVVIKFPF